MIFQVLKGRDVIAQAQSGTGKTATFSISILQSVDTTVRETQILVLSPTRELAVQIQKVILALGDYMNVQVGRFQLYNILNRNKNFVVEFEINGVTSLVRPTLVRLVN